MATTRNRVLGEVANLERVKRKPLGTITIPIKSTNTSNVTSESAIELKKKAVECEKENEVQDQPKVKTSKKTVIVEEKKPEEVPKAETIKENVAIENLTLQDENATTVTEEKPSTEVPKSDIQSEEKENIVDMSNTQSDISEKENVVDITTESDISEDKENIEDITATQSDISEDVSEMTVDTFEPHEDDWCFSKMLMLSLPEYEDEIQKYLLRLQVKTRADPNYLVKHKNELNGKMRTILIDWMVEVVEEYKMTSETLFLAVNFVDRFLSALGVSRSKFQLLGTTALFISSKYEEIYPPDVHEFVYITDNAYDKYDILGMEAKVLKALDFNVSAPTIHYFLRKHLCSLGLELGLPQTVGIMAEYLCYLSLMECDPCIAYLPNDIAVSAIILAADIFGIDLTLSGETGQAFFPEYSKDQLNAHLVELQSCVDTLHSLRKATKMENDELFKSGKPQQAIFNKYAQEKYFSVSLIDIGEQESPKLLP